LRLVAIIVEPDLSDLLVTELIDGDVIPFRPSPIALGPPADEHSRVVDGVQERSGLELKGPFGDGNELLEEGDDLLAPR
jgi:hypothetical protein